MVMKMYVLGQCFPGGKVPKFHKVWASCGASDQFHKYRNGSKSVQSQRETSMDMTAGGEWCDEIKLQAGPTW